VKEFQTPTLVIHGELDFRVPFTQGLELYTALQMRKIPSQLLEFPDEGHWVLKPLNSQLWYKTFIDWVDNWTKKP
jgi:dipeptidyl aminopeptidase/acylaminoacyl peptidase